MYCTCIFMLKAFSNIVYRFCIHEYMPGIGLREAGGGKISEWRYPGVSLYKTMIFTVFIYILMF